MLAQELIRQSNQIVQASSSLKCCRRSNHRGNNKHHVDGNIARTHAKNEHKDKNTYHAVDTHSDTADSGTDENHRQHNDELQ